MYLRRGESVRAVHFPIDGTVFLYRLTMHLCLRKGAQKCKILPNDAVSFRSCLFYCFGLCTSTWASRDRASIAQIRSGMRGRCEISDFHVSVFNESYPIKLGSLWSPVYSTSSTSKRLLEGTTVIPDLSSDLTRPPKSSYHLTRSRETRSRSDRKVIDFRRCVAAMPNTWNQT